MDDFSIRGGKILPAYNSVVPLQRLCATATGYGISQWLGERRCLEMRYASLSHLAAQVHDSSYQSGFSPL